MYAFDASGVTGASLRRALYWRSSVRIFMVRPGAMPAPAIGYNWGTKRKKRSVLAIEIHLPQVSSLASLRAMI